MLRPRLGTTPARLQPQTELRRRARGLLAAALGERRAYDRARPRVRIGAELRSILLRDADGGAWRVDDDEYQLAVREQVESAGAHATPVIDRFWFKSVYFKEPGGVLFELATDGPGFAIDEDREHLGESLVLPPFLEPHRADIERVLPPLSLHTGLEGAD